MNRFKFLAAFVAVAAVARMASACPPIAVDSAQASGVQSDYAQASVAVLAAPVVTYQTYAVPVVNTVSVLVDDVHACGASVANVSVRAAGRPRFFRGRGRPDVRVRVNASGCH